MKVLFYTSVPRSFQTTLIGNLYELCQVYPVVLLAEELNMETEKILHNRTLFPELKKIVSVRQYTGKKINPVCKNYYLYHLAKTIVKEYKPDIVITANDVYPFEMYLMRFAQKVRAVNVCFQAALQIKDREGEVAWSVLQNANSQYPRFLPIHARLLLVRLKKFLGYFFYYWVFPVAVGQRPFLSKSSFIVWNTSLAPQVSDYQIVFSERDYDLYRENGFPAERVFIVPHPLKRRTREIFQKIHSPAPMLNLQKEKNTVTVMWPDETVSFKKSDYSLISEKELWRQRIRVVTLLSQILRDWKIFIKPHPTVKNDKNKFQEIENNLKPLSPNIEITNPEEAAEKYIELSDIVVGLPPVSTTLFIAQMQCPEKPILSLNVAGELLGNGYEDAEGIEYIDSEEKFIAVLKLIRDNRYQKKPKDKRGTAEKEFSNTTEAIEALYGKR